MLPVSPRPSARSSWGKLDRNLALKAVEVIADGHGEGQQLFQRLLRLVEGYGDAAGLQPDPRREVLELLRKNLDRGLDQELRPFQALLLQLRQDFGDLAPALPLVKAAVAFGQAAQVGDEGIPVGQTVGADAVGNARGQDLLGSAAADAEQEFHRGPVDERAGKRLKLPDDVVDFAVPDWFCGHGGASPC